MRILSSFKKILIRYPRLANMSCSSPNILFLFRSVPDFDHTVPVAYKLSETYPDLKVIFCCVDIKFAFNQTPLHSFLTEELGVKCVYLHELCLPTLYHRWFSKYVVYNEVIRDGILSKVLNRIGRRILKEVLYDSRYAHYFLKSQNIRSIVIDVLSSKPWPHQKWFYGAILPTASEHQVPIYWMHHAPPIVNNKLHYDTHDTPNGMGYEWISTFLVCSEWLCSYYNSRGVKIENIKVVGNSRYCREWLKKWSDYCQILNCERNPSPRLKSSGRFQSRRLRVIMIESHQRRIIRDKYLELIKALAGLQGIELKVLPHPRKGTVSHPEGDKEYVLSKYNPELIADRHQPSTNMVQWCDVAIVVYSSLVWECLERNKYLVHVDYISNKTFEHIFFNKREDEVGLYGTNTKEVLERLQDIQQGRAYRPMDNPAYRQLRKNIIYGGLEEDSVLKRHAEVISSGMSQLKH